MKREKKGNRNLVAQRRSTSFPSQETDRWSDPHFINFGRLFQVLPWIAEDRAHEFTTNKKSAVAEHCLEFYHGRETLLGQEHGVPTSSLLMREGDEEFFEPSFAIRWEFNGVISAEPVEAFCKHWFVVSLFAHPPVCLLSLLVFIRRIVCRRGDANSYYYQSFFIDCKVCVSFHTLATDFFVFIHLSSPSMKKTQLKQKSFHMLLFFLMSQSRVQ
jgi:hypothetical protein